MILSEEDGKLFFKLWYPLLDYANKKYNIEPKLLGIANIKNPEYKGIKNISNKIFENTSIIDEYLAINKEIPEDEKNIVINWKKGFCGKFFIERHLKKGSVFISEGNNVYLVKGLTTPWEEMFFYYKLPIFIEATLMPFKNVIITDGIVIPYNIIFGGNYKRELKDVCIDAKKGGDLHTSL